MHINIICHYNVRVPTPHANKKNAKQIHYMVDFFIGSDFVYFNRVKAEIDLFGHLMMTKVGLNGEIADNKHIVLLEFQGSINSNSGMI